MISQISRLTSRHTTQIFNQILAHENNPPTHVYTFVLRENGNSIGTHAAVANESFAYKPRVSNPL